ncbi:MAG: tetratricopeptide repeat protein [bacterium]
MVFLLLLLTCLPAAWPVQGEKQRPCNVLLITIDTLRADHLGCYGYRAIQTPNIDALARQGVLFWQAFTPVPITLPSHVSLLSGLYPHQHGVLDNGSFSLKKETLTLAEILKERGFSTGAIIGSFVLDSTFGLDQGFDDYNDHLPKQQTTMAVHFSERRAAEVTGLALSRIRDHKNRKRFPFFLWLHYFDPHAPYEAPEPFKGRYSQSPYDGEIASVDHCLGTLFQELKKQGLFDQTLIVLTADHGEGLGEHQESTHGNFLYDSTIRVPLILKLPKNAPDGDPKQVKSLVRTIDVLPTILDLAGLSAYIPKKIDGLSMLPLIRRSQDQNNERCLRCETFSPLFHYGWSPELGVRTAQWKYIEAPKPELYYLIQDPGEKVNLYRQQHPKASELRSSLESSRRLGRLPSPSSSSPAQRNRLIREQLQSLGYLQVKAPLSPRAWANLPDAKDKVEVLKGIDEGVADLAQGRYQEALGKFTAIVGSDPANISALFYQACLYRRLRQYSSAIDALRKILDLDPTHLDIHNHLGSIYHEIHDPNQAIREFRQEIELHPNHAEAYYNLAVDYADQGKIQKALDTVRTLLRLDQTSAEGYNLRGKIRIREGDPAGAEGDFRKAISLWPEYADAHNNLGVLYGQQGKQAQALRELTLAGDLDPQNAGILINLANACLQHKHYSLAEKHFQRALLLEPGSIEAREGLGRIYLQKGQPEKARILFEQVIQTSPKRAGTRLLLGQAYALQDYWPKARKEWEAAIRLDPGCDQAYTKLGNLFFQQGQNAEAFSNWKKAISLNPKNLEAYHNLGAACFQQGKVNEAIAAWKEILRIDPNSASAHLHLGSARFQQGDIQSAISEWKKVLEAEPGNFEALSNLGSACIQKGMPEEAKRYWQKAVEIRPESADLHFNLAIIFLQQGMMARGESELLKVLKINPRYPRANELLQQVKSRH